MIPTAENILSIYRRASGDAFLSGMTWYKRAHDYCLEAAEEHNLTVEQVAGIVAALSPMNRWPNNKRKAMEFLARKGDIVAVKGKPNGIGLSENVNKAKDIYNGVAPLDALKGNKVRSFYLTILDPDADVEPVIDRHAFDIAVGMRTDDKTRGMLERKGMYTKFADEYRQAAGIAGLSPSMIQAITWVEWKDMHGIE